MIKPNYKEVQIVLSSLRVPVDLRDADLRFRPVASASNASGGILGDSAPVSNPTVA